MNVSTDKIIRIQQGDIISDVEYIEYADVEDGVVKISKIRFPHVIVLSQECDLTWDYESRDRQRKNQQEGKFVAKVIGVDVDQYSESDTVITSAMKQLSNSVYDGITMFYDGKFPGGKTSIFSVKNNGVGAAMDHARFETFSKADYDTLYNDLKAGKYTIFNDVEDYNPETALKELSNTKVKFIE